MELLHTERKYVQDLEVMQVRGHNNTYTRSDLDDNARLVSLVEILRRSGTIPRSGHASSAVPRFKQASELSEKVPHQSREYR